MGSYSLESGTDIWVQDSHSNLSSVLKMYCIEQSVLAQREEQTAQPENNSSTTAAKWTEKCPRGHWEGGRETRKETADTFLPSRKLQSLCPPAGESQEPLSPANGRNALGQLPGGHRGGGTDTTSSFPGRTPSWLPRRSPSRSQRRLSNPAL